MSMVNVVLTGAGVTLLLMAVFVLCSAFRVYWPTAGKRLGYWHPPGVRYVALHILFAAGFGLAGIASITEAGLIAVA